MAKIIEKIVKSVSAPDENVLWDDGKNLKINRRGVWENANEGGGEIKEGSIPLSALNDEVRDMIKSAGGGADWNAAEGEVGYIKNKPFSANDKVITIPDSFEGYIYTFELVNEDFEVWITYEDKKIPFLANVPKYHDVESDDGEYYWTIDWDGNGTLIIAEQYSEILNPSHIEIHQNIEQISEALIPDTIARKSEIEGFDPVVWKYMCEPLFLYTGKKIPNELLTNNGNLKYKYPNMYRIKPMEDDEGFFDVFHSDSSAVFIPNYLDSTLLMCRFPTYKSGTARATSIELYISNGVVDKVEVITE